MYTQMFSKCIIVTEDRALCEAVAFDSTEVSASSEGMAPQTAEV